MVIYICYKECRYVAVCQFIPPVCVWVPIWSRLSSQCTGTYLVETVHSSVWVPNLVETVQSSVWIPIGSRLSSPVYGYLSGRDCPVQCMGTYLVETVQSRPHRYPYTHTQTELIDIQPHTDTLYNKCKSPFQFSNLAKYGHGPPEDGFKGDRNV